MCENMQASVPMHSNAGGKARRQGFSFTTSHPTAVRQGLILNFKFTDLARPTVQCTLGIPLSLTHAASTFFFFSMGAGDLNSGPHACKAGN